MPIACHRLIIIDSFMKNAPYTRCRIARGPFASHPPAYVPQDVPKFMDVGRHAAAYARCECLCGPHPPSRSALPNERPLQSFIILSTNDRPCSTTCCPCCCHVHHTLQCSSTAASATRPPPCTRPCPTSLAGWLLGMRSHCPRSATHAPYRQAAVPGPWHEPAPRHLLPSPNI